MGDRAFIDAVRIAVGKKVFNKKCELSFQFGTHDPYILFSYVDKDKQQEHSVFLNGDELQELKYFVEGDEEYPANDTVEPMTVISFRIKPTDKNNFKKYSNAYTQEDTEDEERNDRRYISVEVRDADEFKVIIVFKPSPAACMNSQKSNVSPFQSRLQDMLLKMREHKPLEIWCNESSEIPFDDLAKYTKALQEENRKERERRRSVGRRTRSGGNKQKKDGDDKLLLVYPFDTDQATLTEAASELKELGGDSLGVESAHDAGQLLGAAPHDQADGGDITNRKGNSSSRTHFVTIRQNDKERLSPGQFLNDSLVDFWMRW